MSGGHFSLRAVCPLYPQKRTVSGVELMSAKGHVWTAPGWQELFSRLQRWSVRPCVRPFSAVLMTAGHNALRGSGPNRKHAFKDATTQTGSPDPRIDAGGKLLNPVALPPGRGKLAT